jgi:calcineurin-like phosphoesterase family protein
MSDFFSSDYHFYHKNVIKYCNRPFNNVEEMNEKIISNHNKLVRPINLGLCLETTSKNDSITGVVL